MRLVWHSIVCSAVVVSTVLSVQAESVDWNGEGSLSASNSTGNTETTDIGVGLILNRKAGVWDYRFNLTGDFGETNGVESKNRIFLGANVDHHFTDRLFGFVSGSYEVDEFSGFDSRTFVGGGLGLDIYEDDKRTWNIRGGPGYKIDEIQPIFDLAEPPNQIAPAMTENSVSGVAESAFSYKLNNSVDLTNDSKALYAETSTQFSNILALNAALTDTLSARFSYEIRNDTNPPEGFEATDTVTRFSIVYGFGP